MQKGMDYWVYLLVMLGAILVALIIAGQYGFSISDFISNKLWFG